ncbi:MAG: four helix bundle protein [Acidobacteria bacterium]|nr:four helix bundle protein [Acidobacteriota bacterium]MCA1651410.1 four helix bundle protein [Acidobacteriota bacterium]
MAIAVKPGFRVNARVAYRKSLNIKRDKGQGRRDKGEGKRDIRERAFLFACEIIAFGRLVADRGYLMARLAAQLVAAGGSVGANLEEAAEAQSKADFIAKNFIALKEAREARFWLRLISASEKSRSAPAQPLITEASEFVAMLTAGIKRARSNPHRGQR